MRNLQSNCHFFWFFFFIRLILRITLCFGVLQFHLNGFTFIYPTLNLICFFNISTFHQFWKILSSYFFSVFISLSVFSFWKFFYIYIYVFPMESKKSFHFSFIFFFFSPHAMKAQSFNHWIIREVPPLHFSLYDTFWVFSKIFLPVDSSAVSTPFI